MCGRFNNHLSAMHGWADLLADWPTDEALRGYNIAPTRTISVVTKQGIRRARWGLVPAWSPEFTSKYPTHNARSETVAQKPTFRGAVQHGRSCLVPIAGYYEWQKKGDIKQPYYVHQPNNITVLAGYWEAWNDQESFTLLTEDAREALLGVHHRMPIMLTRAQAIDWLANPILDDIINTQNHQKMVFYSVDPRVNSARQEGVELIEPQA